MRKMWGANDGTRMQNLSDVVGNMSIWPAGILVRAVYDHLLAAASLFSLRRIIDASLALLAEATFLALSTSTLEPQ